MIFLFDIAFHKYRFLTIEVYSPKLLQIQAYQRLLPNSDKPENFFDFSIRFMFHFGFTFSSPTFLSDILGLSMGQIGSSTKLF